MTATQTAAALTPSLAPESPNWLSFHALSRPPALAVRGETGTEPFVRLIYLIDVAVFVTLEQSHLTCLPPISLTQG